MAALRNKLITAGIVAASIDKVRAPAGLDLGSITPEEIALSIIAEVTQLRRQGQRDDSKRPGSRLPQGPA
jgi:xanthine dehydrogenase accessory factor